MMKRITSVLLALALLMICTAGMADDFDAGIDRLVDICKPMAILTQTDLAWEETQTEEGLTYRMGWAEAAWTPIAVILYGDPVEAIEVTCKLSRNADAEAVCAKFGKVANLVAESAWAAAQPAGPNAKGEYAAVNLDGIGVTPDLLVPMLDAAREWAEGSHVRQEGTLCGYPAVIVWSITAEDQQMDVSLVVSPNTELLAGMQ